MEQTFFMIKPDGVKQGEVVGEVLRWIERLRFTFKRFELIDPKLKAYMTSGPVLIETLLGD